MALDKNVIIFVVYIALFTLKMTIDQPCRAQIALVLAKKAIILAKYLDVAEIFSKKLAKVLPKLFKANEHAIKREQCKKQLYRPIYSLEMIKLEIFKFYIKITLVKNFIKI